MVAGDKVNHKEENRGGKLLRYRQHSQRKLDSLLKTTLISLPWSKAYFNLIFFTLFFDENYLDYVGNKWQEQDQYPKHYLKSIREWSAAK